jgi:hypothetical protein
MTDRSARRRLAVLAGILMLAVAGIAAAAPAAPAPAAALPRLEVLTDAGGSRLQVNGQDFMVLGMNWDYVPIGQNYNYSLWVQPDAIITDVLAREMPLLQAMGVNTIRQYVGVPPRWVQHIYEKYGIFTVLNHTVGRYGLTIDGAWLPNTDYSDPRVRSQLKGEVAALVDEYKNTPGLLMWLLGNENNYGLTWKSAETEALPEGERHAARAEYLYSLFGEIIRDIKQRDPDGLVSMANGDLQYIDLIAKHCKGLDVFGSNVYRGISARDFYQVVKDKLGVPVIFTEFGSDAFNARTNREDQAMQARYLLGQWQEIYEQSAGKGKVGNAAGGLTFQWSDGWWKYLQESRLNIHDTNASWPNGGYAEDFRDGENNMNEEWWGITAKGQPDANGIYEIYPRAAYYALRDAYMLDPYGKDTDVASIRRHFAGIHAGASVLEARGDAAALRTDALSKVRLAGLRMEFETYSTGAKNTSTPSSDMPGSSYPAFKGFDHGQSFWTDFEAMPSDNITGRLSLNILGRVPVNPIDEIFYENRGRPRQVQADDGTSFRMESNERLKVYQSSVSWDDRWFTLDGFYRTGHLHWQYEGDFFGLYRDAYYGENIDIYNGEAPVGFEVAGKRQLAGLKVAFGPQLWWGANPAVLVKYQRSFAGSQWTGVFQEDFAEQSQVTSSSAIPTRTTRKASLAMVRRVGPFNLEAGALWSGKPRVGEPFQIVDEDLVEANVQLAPGDVRQDAVKDKDTFGVKGKLTWQKGRWNWYGQGAWMGLVADGGPTAIPTFTGWELKDSGSGNQVNVLSGAAYTTGNWQVGPNLLWQKPIVGPMPNSEYLAGTAGRVRNVISDPFAVRGNRETTGGELMVTYDPTPATWMWAWDSDLREDAKLAASIGLSVRRHHTSADGGLLVSAEGLVYGFAGATPERDLWELKCRLVSRLSDSARAVSHIYVGTAEPNGDDTRLLHRFGFDTRVTWPAVVLAGYVKVNDFGPYDYHRDFNLTHPLQLMVDLSTTLGSPRWFELPQTRLGVRAMYRTLDRYSVRYAPEGAAEPLPNEQYPEGLEKGNEWEIRTYLHLAI